MTFSSGIPIEPWLKKMLDATVSDGNYSHRNLMFVSVQLVASRDGNAADPAQAWIARCLV